MGKIEDCEKMIRDHDYRLGKAAPMYTGVTLTADETCSLLDYLEVWFPENLKGEEDWDSLEWLYNVLSVWKKCKAAQAPKGPVTFRGDIVVDTGDITKDETFF